MDKIHHIALTMKSINYSIIKATPHHIDQLLNLYFTIYGNDYPIQLGTDREAMTRAIHDDIHYYWPIAIDLQTNQVIGSTIFEIDTFYRIGKVVGVAVNPQYRGSGIARSLIENGTKLILHQHKLVNSLYTTTRTLGLDSQRMFLKNGYIPLGIFPNAKKLKYYETLTLLGIFSPEALEKRASVSEIPELLKEIVTISSNAIPGTPPPLFLSPSSIISKDNEVEEKTLKHEEFEFILAPKFVKKRFNEVFRNDPDARFYPFHDPNLLITNSSNQVELYAHFSAKDHYCVIIAANSPIVNLGKELKAIIYNLKTIGVSYVEVMTKLNQTKTIQYLIDNQFLPVALYPSMREIEGEMHDYILLSRSMEPLNFEGMAIDKSFYPYINQYVQLWSKMHLECLQVYESGNQE